MKFLKIAFVLILGFSAGWLSAQDEDSSSDSAAASAPAPDPAANATEAVTAPPAPDQSCTGDCSNVDQNNYSPPRSPRQDDISKANEATGTAPTTPGSTVPAGGANATGN